MTIIFFLILILKAGGYVMRSLLLGTMNVMIRSFLELKKNCNPENLKELRVGILLCEGRCGR